MAGIAKIEADRRLEQDRLDRLKGAEARNKLGQFATPNALALAIASHLVGLRGDRAEALRFLDPSIGSGSFFSALRQVVGSERVEAVGVEVDPAFAEVVLRLWGPLGLEVVEGDLTRLEPPPVGRRANLVLANPPYVRHHHLGLEEKRRLGELVKGRVGADVSGLAGLYVYFLLLCDAWLEDGGLAAWLIPSEFMNVNYGSAIRDYLTGRVRLRRIHRFRPADAQFGDALVTSAVVIFEKVAPVEGDSVLMSLGGSLDEPGSGEWVPTDSLRSARKWTNYPRGVAIPDAAPAGGTTTLGDLFTIRRGLVTGSNAFFIMTRAEALRLGLPPRFLKPILPSPRYLKEPIIEGDDARDSAASLVLLDCDRPEAEVRSDHPALWAYLQAGVARGLHEGYLTSRRSPWYSQERREVPPFVCTYMGRHRGGTPPFRIFWNRSRAVAANVYLFLYPKGPMLRAIEADPSRAAVVFGLLQAIQPARFIDEGRVYGGGLHKMEPKELAALPFPADALFEAANRPLAPRQAILAGF